MQTKEFVQKRSVGKKIIQLRSQIEKVHGENDEVDLRKNNILLMLMKKHFSLDISPPVFTRAIQWGSMGEEKLKSEVPSISLKTLESILRCFEEVLKLPTNKIKDYLDKEHGNRDIGNTFDVDSDLLKFIGTYISYHPKLSDGSSIMKGTLELKKNLRKNDELIAEYTSPYQNKYKGTCQKIVDTLYIALKDNREMIYIISNVGVKIDDKVDLLHATSSCINNSNTPVSFRRILVRKEKVSNFHDQVIKYLKREHSLIKTEKRDIYKIISTNEDNDIDPSIKGLVGATYTSYNLFRYPKEKELSQNIWEFYEKNGKIRVKRKGAEDRQFKGEVYQINRSHIAILLNRKTNFSKMRLYIGMLPLPVDGRDAKEFDTLKLLGLTVNANHDVVAGREILLLSKNYHDQKPRPQRLLPSYLEANNKILYDKIYDFLENGENAVFPLKKTGTTLEPGLVGKYLVYYLNSKNRNLTRNRAEIGWRNGDAGSGPNYFFTYETDDKAYTVKSIHQSERNLFALIKDDTQKMYFSMHLTYERPLRRKGYNVDILIGSVSSISYSVGKPVAAGILFIRVEDEKFGRMAAKLGILDNPEGLEADIKSYLELIGSNPIPFFPVENVEELQQRLNRNHKENYVEAFKERIMPYMATGLQESHAGFISDLLDIVKSFTAGDHVEFKTQYVSLYRVFHEELLKQFKDKECEFYGVSIAHKNYFWHAENSTEHYIKEFVEGGAKLYRIFFIDSPSGIPDENERKIIQRHFKLYGSEESKGAVYVASAYRIPRYLLKFFFTETNGKISGKVTTEPDRSISKMEIYCEEKTHLELMKIFQEIVQTKSATIQVTQNLIDTWTLPKTNELATE